MDRAMISAAFAARASATGAPISFRHFVRQKRLILERIPFAIVLRYSVRLPCTRVDKRFGK